MNPEEVDLRTSRSRFARTIQRRATQPTVERIERVFAKLPMPFVNLCKEKLLISNAELRGHPNDARNRAKVTLALRIHRSAILETADEC